MSRKSVLPLLFVLFAATTVGCSDDNEKQCTLIGCENGINLNIEDADGKPVNAFKGKITLADKVVEIDCGTAANGHGPEYSCNQNQVFLRATDATEFSVDIYSVADPTFGYIGDLKVTYEPLYPNGEECGEVCKQATKTSAFNTSL